MLENKILLDEKVGHLTELNEKLNKNKNSYTEITKTVAKPLCLKLNSLNNKGNEENDIFTDDENIQAEFGERT